MATASSWQDALAVIGDRRVTLGPQASQQYLDAPDHLAMVLARYRAALRGAGEAFTATPLHGPPVKVQSDVQLTYAAPGRPRRTMTGRSQPQCTVRGTGPLYIRCVSSRPVTGLTEDTS